MVFLLQLSCFCSFFVVNYEQIQYSACPLPRETIAIICLTHNYKKQAIVYVLLKTESCLKDTQSHF